MAIVLYVLFRFTTSDIFKHFLTVLLINFWQFLTIFVIELLKFTLNHLIFDQIKVLLPQAYLWPWPILDLMFRSTCSQTRLGCLAYKYLALSRPYYTYLNFLFLIAFRIFTPLSHYRQNQMKPGKSSKFYDESGNKFTLNRHVFQ